MQTTRHPGVYRLEDGRYRVRVTVTDSQTGERIDKQRTLPESATTADAIKRREKLREQIENDLARKHQQEEGLADIATVGDYAVRWFERKATDLKPTTADLYCTLLDQKILPVLGDVPIYSLSRTHAQQWVAWADRQTKPDGSSYSKATRRSWWRVCKQLLLDAWADFGLDHDPTSRVKPPKVDGGKSRTEKTLTADELGELVEAAREKLPNRYAEILVLTTTGMRAGELYGLKWQDIDYAGGEIHVRRSAPKGTLTQSTKTGTARTVPLAPIAAEVLREHHKSMLTDEHPGLDTGLVFPSNNGRPRYSSGLRKRLKQLGRVLGLGKVTPQVIRRTVNTLCVQNGHADEVLRSIMGHASPEMTELYSGVGIDAKRAAMERSLGAWYSG